jgi:hypothetical protein
VRGGPAGVPAAEGRLPRRAIEREDPLLAVAVLEVADVEVGGLGADGGRNPARRGVVVVINANLPEENQGSAVRRGRMREIIGPSRPLIRAEWDSESGGVFVQFRLEEGLQVRCGIRGKA